MSDTVRFAGPLQSMAIEDGYDPIGWIALTGEAAEAVAAHMTRLEIATDPASAA